MRLLERDEKIGALELELDEFKSDKVIRRDFFKMFSGKKIFPYLSWGLFVSVGLIDSGTISTSTLKLNKKDGILIPQQEYHNPDPLPEDWINMLHEKPDQKVERISTRQVSSSQGTGKGKGVNMLDSEIEEYSRRKMFLE